MDENNYRDTYREFNELPCVYEKAVLQQCCSCRRARHFNLAERIGVACTDTASQERCRQFLAILQEKSVFALQLPNPELVQLPHAKKIKIQCGGVLGLLAANGNNSSDKDVNVLLEQAIDRFEGMESLPYEEIVRSIVRFEGRKRRGQKK